MAHRPGAVWAGTPRPKGKVERFNGYLKGSFLVPLAAPLNSPVSSSTSPRPMPYRSLAAERSQCRGVHGTHDRLLVSIGSRSDCALFAPRTASQGSKEVVRFSDTASADGTRLTTKVMVTNHLGAQREQESTRRGAGRIELLQDVAVEQRTRRPRKFGAPP